METLFINILSSNAVITLIVGAFVTYLVKWYAKREEGLEPYRGIAIAAVHAAEKAIPDDSENKAVRKLDYALRQFISKYETATGEVADGELVAKIESFISVVHDAIRESL